MDSFTTSASKVPDPPAEGGIERHGSVYGFDAEGEEGGEEPEAPPPPPEAVNLNTHLVGEGWLMKLSRQRKGMLQKRYFRVDGDSISHYAHNGKAKASKTPLMLADLRHIRIPSVEPALEGRGFDLIFVTRSITLAAIEEDRLSVAFSKLLRQAKVPASRGDHMESVTGAQLVLVKCDHCSKMQGVAENETDPSCSNCGEHLDMGQAKKADEAIAAEKKHVECGVCGQWLRYPHGVKEVMCTCGALLQLGGGASDGAKLEIDPVVLAKVVEMRQRVQDQRATIKSLSEKLDELKVKAAKRGITEKHDTPVIKNASKKRGMNGRSVSVSHFAMSGPTGGGAHRDRMKRAQSVSVMESASGSTASGRPSFGRPTRGSADF